jgi:hypothetical protein
MSQALSVFVVAFAIVFTGMLLLMAILYLLRAAGRFKPAIVEPSAPAPDHELIAVLAAAAHAALGAPVRVHRVHIHREHATEAWARAGRMDIMVSHRMEPKR